MHAFLIATLIALQASPTPEPLPETVEGSIERCEMMEYADPEGALRIVEHGLSLDAPRSAAQRGLLLACRAWSQIQLGRLDEARELTLEIEALAGQDGSADDRVGLLIRLSQLHFRGGDGISALETVERAQQLAEAEALVEVLPPILGNIAIYLTEAGQFDAAIAHFERLLAMAEADGTEPGRLVPVRFNLARALMLDGRYGDAIEHLEWLIPAMSDPREAPRQASAMSMLGFALGKLGETERSDDMMARAEALHQQFDNPGELSVLRKDQAELALDRGKLELAEGYGREALDLARQIQYERSVLDALSLLVDILEQGGQYEEALALHREFAERKQGLLETSQRSRLNTLEARLGMQQQARELDELRQAAELRELRLAEESFRRRVAWTALIAVVIAAIGLSIWQRANQQRLLRISRTDPLTGLANRRFLTLQMQSQGETVQRGALLLLDLDHFKSINDRYGHDVGDQVLLEVSALIDDLADAHGALCGRWGGEEFALFLPEATDAATESLAEALRSGIDGLEIRNETGEHISVTASLGFAPIRGLQLDSGQEVWEPALKAADLLLYRAKDAGRNCGFGAWPAEGSGAINPLALGEALEAGRFRLIRVPETG